MFVLRDISIISWEHVIPQIALHSIPIDFSNDITTLVEQPCFRIETVTNQRNNHFRVAIKISAIISREVIEKFIRECKAQKRNQRDHPVLKSVARQLGKQWHTDRVRWSFSHRGRCDGQIKLIVLRYNPVVPMDA